MSIYAPRRREQFLAGRCLARQLLCAAYGGDPLRDWPLSSGEDTAPVLLRGGPPWVAISHSGDWVACAASQRRVGIDVERLDERRNRSALMAAVCTASELAHLLALPYGQRAGAFTSLWTLKEAWFKRRSLGVDTAGMAALQTHPMTPGDTETAQVFRCAEAVLSLVADQDALVVWHPRREAWTADSMRWGFSPTSACARPSPKAAHSNRCPCNPAVGAKPHEAVIQEREES